MHTQPVNMVVLVQRLHVRKNFSTDFSELKKLFEQEMMSFCHSILGYTE